MPTLLVVNGLRFFFYSNENNEPIHVHISKGDANGKVWLEPSIAVEYLIGFSNAEESTIMETVKTNSESFKRNGMNTSQNKQFDVIDHLIFSEGLRIQAIDIQPDLDLMTIYLNTKAALSHHLSSFKLLHGADKSKLMNYELIGGGVGIHWPLLDEDLSLKGLLEDELRKVVKGKYFMAA